MFRTISDLLPSDRAYSERTRRLLLLRRVLDGTLYDALPHEFHEERTASGEYIPLRQRRPSVRYALPRIVVEDSIALLFSEGHFPTLCSEDAELGAWLGALAADARLNGAMTEAARLGSVGSAALLFRVMKGRVFVNALATEYLSPLWEEKAPDTLRCVTERYKASGADLQARGFAISDPGTDYWFTRRWDAEWETWFAPQRVGADTPLVVDEGRSVRHGLGFVPIVWVRNLPGGDAIDGACTFEAAIETSIEIDYQLSQAGRGLKYSSDPTLLIREPAGFDGEMVRGAANALIVSEKGDAKLLEIGGTASQAVIDYVRTLRELALESVHGNRADASRLSVPASGRALQLMNQGLTWLADNLRVSYGAALVELARMMVRASRMYPLKVAGRVVPPLENGAHIRLRWPDWYGPDALDRQREAETVLALVRGGQMSRETGVHVLAAAYGIADVPAELARIAAEGGGADAGLV